MNRKKALGPAAIAIGILGAAWWCTVSWRVGLPHGSVKVASVSSWGKASTRSKLMQADKRYFWTTDGDLLRPQKAGDGSTIVLREHLTPLNTLQSDPSPPVRVPGGASFLQPTPDGSGLLYWRPSAVHINDMDVHLLTADGKADRLLPALWMMNTVWMPDGKHWIVTRDDGDFLNSTDGAPFRKLSTQTIGSFAPYVLGVNQESHAIATFGNEWFEASNPTYGAKAINYPTVLLIEFDPAASSPSGKGWRVHAPERSIRGQILLSPRADRILWAVEKQAPVFAQWLDRIRSGNNKVLLRDQAVYVSRMDGSDMRELFSASMERQNTGKFVSVRRPLSDIRWLPDGKRISFVYKDDLYLAPVH